MPQITFAHILFEKNPRALQNPAMYCRATGQFSPIKGSAAKDIAWRLEADSTFDFMTYFNALSVGKLKKYTDAEHFALHLEHRGGQAQLQLTTADAFSHSPEPFGEPYILPASQDWKEFDVDLPFNDAVVLDSFILTTQDEDVDIRRGTYSMEVPHELHPVNLALATTTFKKEDFIKSNIKLVREHIIDTDDEIAQHFHMYVIDNGRTLPVDELSGDRITIRPNQNVGGAGGFTRGMIEAMEQKDPATHVLLMDDDVSIAPESIIRTYALLRSVNGKYREAVVSGMMLNFNQTNTTHEDTAFLREDGMFIPAKPPLDINMLEDLVFNENFKLSSKIPVSQQYAAWWYCCIPLSVIRRAGLPLPYFVRVDDAEYGTRIQAPLMTMNGIGIWHMPFYIRYNEAVDHYQATRNCLIAQFTTHFAEKSDFMYQLHNNIRLELKKFGYDSADLLLDAFEDFLKGPEFYSAKGMAEKTFLLANKKRQKMYDYDELEKQAAALGLDFKADQYTRQIIFGDKPRSRVQRLDDYLTDNGQRFLKRQGEGYIVIPADGWAYPAGVIRGKQYIILVDWYSRKGTIRTKDVERFKQVSRRYHRDLKYFKAHEKELHERYEASRAQVTSLEFWKNYLDMD